jgi:hypothetical protein
VYFALPSFPYPVDIIINKLISCGFEDIVPILPTQAGNERRIK